MLLSLVVHHLCSVTGRNRCCVEIMLSWTWQNNLGLMDVTPLLLLQADDLGRGWDVAGTRRSLTGALSGRLAA